jgi:hypothetical protein
MRSAWPVLLFLSAAAPLAGQPVPGAAAPAIHITSSRTQDGGMTVWEIPFEAAAQWQFAPGTKDGEPVPVLVTVELTFNTK